MNLTQLTLVAFLVESLIQTFKPIYDKEKGWNKNSLLALIVGIIVCVAASVDLFSTLGLEIQVPFVGSVLTGVLASRGSNFLHDILKFVEQRAHSDPFSTPVG